MRKFYDIMVLGLGANGSAAIYQLSRTGYKVAGIDQFTPPHAKGSSHGESRIIRQAYYESPLYVPFVKQAYHYWHQLEKESNQQLLLQTGGLMLGSPDSVLINGAHLSATTHQIPFEYLQATEITGRFPALKPSPDTVAILEKEAGILFPEKCIDAFLRLADHNGAALHFDEQALQIVPHPTHVDVITANNRYTAQRIIISAGAWLNQLLPGMQLPLTIERQVLFWLDDAAGFLGPAFTPPRLPVYLWEYMPGKIFYGFANLGSGIKIATHNAGRAIEHGKLGNDITEGEIDEIKKLAQTYLHLNPVLNNTVTCMYTTTPDGDFIIDFHPQHPNIIVASPCSGHGFKFASFTGKILADMAIGIAVSEDISPFSISRFL